MRKVISIVLALALIMSTSALAFATGPLSSPDVITLEFKTREGESGSITSMSLNKGSSVTLPISGITKSGYTISGWTFDSGNTTTATWTTSIDYASAKAYMSNEKVELYATWTVYSGGSSSGDSTPAVPATTTETTSTDGDVTVNMSTKDANSDEYATPAVTAEATKEEAPSAQTVTLNVPATTSGGDTVVELTAKNYNIGIVAMEKIGNTYKLIKKSAAGEKGPIIKATTGKHTYVLVNNSKTVTDVTETWMGRGIQFMLSRELMQGVGGGKFNPYGTVDASTIVTVFGRFDDKITLDQSSGQNWEAAGQAWATEHGYPAIGELPRIDMFGVAYKYNNSPAVTQAQIDAFKATFNDVDGLTDEQLKYGAWALANGYTNGVGNGRFGGSELSDRGQFSTFFERYAKDVVK